MDIYYIEQFACMCKDGIFVLYVVVLTEKRILLTENCIGYLANVCNKYYASAKIMYCIVNFSEWLLLLLLLIKRL